MTLLDRSVGTLAESRKGADENCAAGNEPMETFDVTMEVPADVAAPTYGFFV
jgi:hypothetical protein